jgi:hypothetical protein
MNELTDVQSTEEEEEYPSGSGYELDLGLTLSMSGRTRSRYKCVDREGVASMSTGVPELLSNTHHL